MLQLPPALNDQIVYLDNAVGKAFEYYSPSGKEKKKNFHRNKKSIARMPGL